MRGCSLNGKARTLVFVGNVKSTSDLSPAKIELLKREHLK